MVRSIRNMWLKSMASNSIISQERCRITSLLFVLSVVYIALCLPVSVVMIMEACGYFQSVDAFHDVNLPSVLVVYLTTVADPFMYAFYWKGFRNGFMPARRKITEAVSRLPSFDKYNRKDTKLSAMSVTTASSSTMDV